MSFIFIIMFAFAVLGTSCMSARKNVLTEEGAAVGVFYTFVIAMLFALALMLGRGAGTGMQFISGYGTEWLLSVDNLMAIFLVFQYFGLPREHEPRILQWGLVSAVVFRLIFTLIGTDLLGAGRWAEGFFGLLVAVTAFKMLVAGGDSDAKMVDHNERWYVRSLRRWIPVTGFIPKEPKFFVEVQDRGSSKIHATPLLACLIAVEVTDLMFSFDSVPAVVSISRAPLVIFSAMMFAIVGLRQMYFLIPGVQRYFTRLPQTVAAILVLVAIRMLLSAILGIQITNWVFLLGIMGFISIGLYVSIAEGKKDAEILQKRSGL